MTPWDWSPYLIGGGTRSDAMSGLSPEFSAALQSMFSSAPADIQSNLRVNSAYRSPEVQERLWNEALVKYGTPELARKWVAPPGKSQHNHGNAADLKYLSPEAQAWAHANAKTYGLAFPLSNENWHIELAGARGGDAHAAPKKLDYGIENKPGILPWNKGETVDGESPWAKAAGILADAMQARPQVQAPEIAPRQVQQYQPTRRETSALLQFLATLG